jgi:hypothetical protein
MLKTRRKNLDLTIMEVLNDLRVLNEFALGILRLVVKFCLSSIEIMLEHVDEFIFLERVVVIMFNNLIDSEVIFDACSD